MNVVGIDPSLTCTGFAYANGNTNAVKFKQRPRGVDADRWTMRRVRILQAHTVIAIAGGCDVVAIEGYAYGAANKRESLGYLGWSIRETLAGLNVPYVDIAPSTLKGFATGSGKAAKQEMQLAAVEQLGLKRDATADEADAAWLRDAVLHLAGESTRLPPSDRAAFLKKIELPEGLKT